MINTERAYALPVVSNVKLLKTDLRHVECVDQDALEFMWGLYTAAVNGLVVEPRYVLDLKRQLLEEGFVIASPGGLRELVAS